MNLATTDLDVRVRRVVAEHFGIDMDEITGDTTANDVGGDSLDSIELIMALEDEFHIAISDEQAEKCVTVQNMVDMLVAHPELN